MRWKFILKKKNTGAYQEAFNIDIEDIDIIKNINNHDKTHWMTIYEVIQQGFFDETDIFSE